MAKSGGNEEGLGEKSPGLSICYDLSTGKKRTGDPTRDGYRGVASIERVELSPLQHGYFFMCPTIQKRMDFEVEANREANVCHYTGEIYDTSTGGVLQPGESRGKA